VFFWKNSMLKKSAPIGTLFFCIIQYGSLMNYLKAKLHQNQVPPTFGAQEPGK
jgi:hypothetical protein